MKTYYVTDDLDFCQNIYDRRRGYLLSIGALTGPQTDRDSVGLHKMLFNPLVFLLIKIL